MDKFDFSKYDKKTLLDAYNKARAEQPRPSSTGTLLGDALNTLDPSGKVSNMIFSGLRSAASGKIEGPTPTLKGNDLSSFKAKEDYKELLRSQRPETPLQTAKRNRTEKEAKILDTYLPPDGESADGSATSDENGMIMTSARVGGIGLESPAGVRQMERLKAEEAANKTNVESANKLGTAVKRLKILNSQFKSAIPSGTNSPATQRIMGPLQTIGAKTGVVPNAELNAIKKNSRPIGIQLIRAFGEVGNLSGPEQASAIDLVNQEGLTDEERIATVRQFAEFALAGASPQAIEYLSKDPEVLSILEEFGIQLAGGESDGGGGDDELSEIERRLSELGG